MKDLVSYRQAYGVKPNGRPTDRQKDWRTKHITGRQGDQLAIPYNLIHWVVLGDHHSAGSTPSLSASQFCTRQAQVVPQVVQEGHFWLRILLYHLHSVNEEGDFGTCSLHPRIHLLDPRWSVIRKFPNIELEQRNRNLIDCHTSTGVT
jgi:hypothetical protein